MIFELDCEYSDDTHEKIDHFLSSSGYTLDGDTYKRYVMGGDTNAYVCSNISIKRENNKTLVEAFVFNVRKLNPIEHGLSGLYLMFQKRALRKTAVVVLELFDSPNEKKI